MTDGASDPVVPFHDGEGRVTFSGNVHPSEIRQWANERPEEIRFACHLIAGGFERLWAANRKIKAPLGRAERYLLCAADMEQALESAKRTGVEELVRIASGLSTGLRPQCDALAARAIEVFQDQQAEKLSKASTTEKQLKAIDASLKALKRMTSAKYVPTELKLRIAALNEFWTDQRELITASEESSNATFSAADHDPARFLSKSWFKVDVVDKSTGDAWSLRVPSDSAEAASNHLWRMGFITGTPSAWTPRPDPVLRAAMRELAEGGFDPDPEGLTTRPEGELRHAYLENLSEPVSLPRMFAALDLEADPIDRHELLQQLAMYICRDEQRVSQRCLGVCWQWWAEMFAIRTRVRSSGAASVLDVLAPAMDCADFVFESLDEELHAERLATLNEVFEEFIN